MADRRGRPRRHWRNGGLRLTDDDPFLPYEPVDHTADLAYCARGRTLAELFENAALGMMSFLTEPGAVRPSQEDRIEIEGSDLEELLVTFLQEILFRLEARGRVYSAFRVEAIALPRLRARAQGENLDRSRHVLLADIKAATYHDLRITREDSPAGCLYKVRIVLDI